jgi:hypothetical protein
MKVKVMNRTDLMRIATGDILNEVSYDEDKKEFVFTKGSPSFQI